MIFATRAKQTERKNTPFPRTRYQGSKRKLAGAILRRLSGLEFTTVLDAFGGTGAVAHAFKCAGKAVTYNDMLEFNKQIGRALIENDAVRLNPEEIEAIGRRQPGIAYGDFIERTFEGIYFTPEENRWLDTAVANIAQFECPFKGALAWFGVFQAAMAKRPYNLFHRKNLYMRTAQVKRGFGNKTTWERSFPEHFGVFVEEANRAIIESGGRCRARCGDALEIEPGFDLVYIDTPYISRAGVGVDYRDFYHFLEGMVRYADWPGMLDQGSKHLRLKPQRNPWVEPATCPEMFRRLFARFHESILVVSYRSDGIPTIDDLAAMLRQVKRHVRVFDGDRYQYALSTKRATREVLLVGTD